MLDLLTTEDFATWFSTLEAAPAEDVAATLEVIVHLGTRIEAPGSSDALLWYEDPSVSQQVLPERSVRASAAVLKISQEWGRVTGYVKRIVKHLESPAFVARLAHLSSANAATVAAALTKIRRTSTMRGLAFSEFHTKNRFFINKEPTPRDEETLAVLLDMSEIRQAYFAALAAAGFEVADVPPNPAALREISLRATAPGLRLLYGVDEPKNRGLVVLGEWLDRSFYGDSVRRAEEVWGQFLEGRSLSVQPAAGR